MWAVYVIQSLMPRPRGLPGFHYVGCTTDPVRRLLEHNGLYASGKTGNPKGSKYTACHRPWQMRAIFGPFENQSEAIRAERALKHGKRGPARVAWCPEDSPWCRGLGPLDPRVAIANETLNRLQQGVPTPH